MVVCKFFQQGNCRYGQNCRFDHIYGSKYSYHASAPTTQPVTAVGAVTDEQLVNQVNSDVQSILKGNQWILSCYSPFKEKPNFPGLSDLSMEEARLFIYEAKANNNLDQALTYMNHLFQDTRNKYEQLLQPNVTILKVLRSLYRGEIVNSPFTNNNQSSNSAATSIFRSAVQGTSAFEQNTNSVFGQSTANASIFGQPSVFGQSANTPPSVFNQQPILANTDTSAKSIFAQANQNIFSQNSTNANIFASNQPVSNVFEKADATAKSIFTQANQKLFQTNQLPSNPVSVFSNVSQSSFNPSPFNQQTDSIFSSQNSAPFTNVFQISDKQNPDDNSIYSDVIDLSDTDMEAFKSENFRLGSIPTSPPPHSVCF